MKRDPNRLRWASSGFAQERVHPLLGGGLGGGVAVYAKMTAILRENGKAWIPLARFMFLVLARLAGGSQ